MFPKMVRNEFKVGDLVWAKMKGFPAWPAEIIEPPSNAPKPLKQKKPQHYVYFFGSNNHAWVLDENIVPHSDDMVQNANKRKSSTFQSAVEEIVNCSKHSGKEGENSIEKQNAEEIAEDILTRDRSTFPKKSEKKLIKIVNSGAQKKAKKRTMASMENGAESLPFPKSSRMINDYSSLLSNVPPNISYGIEVSSSVYHDETHQSRRLQVMHDFVERPPTPPLDVETVGEILKQKNITPTTKCIGFLGLGLMGRGIVKNLVNSGHNVIVWNRTPDKVEPFLRAGVSQARTPADVIIGADITFCCISNATAAKCLVFGNNGILRGLDSCDATSKSYVEMTTVDPETSEAIASAISMRGARYLEASINGTKKDAIDGTLLIFAAGEKSLFDDCKTCFDAIGKDSFFISSLVGSAAKFHIIYTTLHGIVNIALAEAMALIECNPELKHLQFLEVLEKSSLNCPAVIEKVKAIIARNFETNTSLKHMTKHVELALSLSNNVEQPLPMAAAANEIYKHAALLRYGDHDAIAVFQGVKH